MATGQEISRVKRDFPPAHFILKIESYSQLSKAEEDKYDSDVFKAAGYNWRLILYPNGNRKSNGKGYISLYLAIDDSSYFSSNNWQVYVNFKFFVHDKIKNEHLAIQYADGAVRRFDNHKKQWGIDQLLPLKAFKERSNGYLVDDSCVFGAEVFVIIPTGRAESLSIVNELGTRNIHPWRISKFSELNDRDYYSDPFMAGGRTWKIVICPKGDDNAKDYLSFYVSLQDSEDIFQSKRKVYAKYKMRVLDHPRMKIEEQTSSCWFSSEFQESGYPKFMALEDLKSGGYLMSDTLLVEVEFLVVSLLTDRRSVVKDKQ